MGALNQEIAAFGMELQGNLGTEHGPQSVFNNGLFQEVYLGIPAMRIAGGSDEVQRNVIAERELGIPQETRVDKGIPFKDIPSAASR